MSHDIELTRTGVCVPNRDELRPFRSKVHEGSLNCRCTDVEARDLKLDVVGADIAGAILQLPVLHVIKEDEGLDDEAPPRCEVAPARW